MKNRSIKILIFLSILILSQVFGQKPESDPVLIVIFKIMGNENNIDLLGKNLEIWNNNQHFKTIQSDANNVYTSLLRNNMVSIDLYYSGLGINEKVFLRNIKVNSDTIRKTIILPIKYKKNLFGKPKCPKCYKSNSVIPIKYIPITFLKIEKGDTTYSQINNGIYYIPSDVISNLDAKWFCKADSIFF